MKLYLRSLRDFGLGPKMISYVKTLFGNALAKIIVNGDLTKTFPFKNSMRQGCPLAPVCYAIAVAGLNWMILKGI